MTVEMGIRHLESNEYEVVPVSCSETFRRVWLPACKRLELELVSHFHDGLLTKVNTEDIPQIISELDRLRKWAVGQMELGFVVERIDAILRVFRETDPSLCEYDFG